MLGIQPLQVKSLIELGVLSALRFGSALRYLRRSEVADLLRAVEALPSTDGCSGFMPLKTFSTSRKIGIARIVAVWHSGELQGLVARREGKGLQALCLQPDVLCQKAPTPRHGDPNLAEAARYLRISLSAIRTLRDVGILRQVRKRNADTNFRQGYISIESLRSFERDHVTLGQLAERNAVAPIHLARRLDRDGIPALDTPRGMVRVYHQDMLPTDLLFGVNIPPRDSGAFQQGGLPWRHLTIPTAMSCETGPCPARRTPKSHGPRDHLMLLLMYRHGLRVSELIDLKRPDLDLASGHLWVRRLKRGLSTNHPLNADEIRALTCGFHTGHGATRSDKRPDTWMHSTV